jgi:hypothetical protein
MALLMLIFCMHRVKFGIAGCRLGCDAAAAGGGGKNLLHTFMRSL